MVEVSKPDYLSMVNQNGTGFNISELVTAMVDSEIVPKKVISEATLKKNETSVSAMGELKSGALLQQGYVKAQDSKSLFTVASTAAANITATVKDSSKLTNSSHIIDNVITAKTMVYELPSFASTYTTSETLTIDFGSWTQSSTGSETTITHPTQLTVGKTYEIVAARGTGTAFDNHTRDPHNPTASSQFLDASSSSLQVGDKFRVGTAFSDSDFDFKELDNYSFTEKTGNSTVTINSTGATLTVQEMVALINDVSGIKAKLIQKSEGGTDYSVVLTSENTGAENAFKITSNASGDAGQRWQTSLFSSANAHNGSLNQRAVDASFNLDGVAVTRSSNAITDLIDGVEFGLQQDVVAATTISSSRSKDNIKAVMNELVTTMNEYKAQLDGYTFVDPDGVASGPLALDPTVTKIKSDFMKLLVNPITGYDFGTTYLSELGIKTSSSGGLYIDDTTFERTYSSKPEKFNALNQVIAKSDNANATVYLSEYTDLAAGEYELKQVSGSWKLGTIDITRTANSDGSYKFTSSDYAGFYVSTTDSSSDLGKIYIGRSFTNIFDDYVDNMLASTSSFTSTLTAYETKVEDITEQLDALEVRADLIRARYNKRFGEMESMVVGFNSTKSLLENLVKSWNREK